MNYTDIRLSSLTPLSEFPNYFVDTTEGKVYSIAPQGRFGNKKPRLLKGFKSHKSAFGNDAKIRDARGVLRRVRINRLIACAVYGVSYSTLPKDVIINFVDGEGLQIKSYSDASKNGWDARRKKIMEERIRFVDHNMDVLKLLRLAYEGNATPLIEYIYGRKNWYISRLTGCDRQYGYKTSVFAVEKAIDNFIEIVILGGSQTICVDGWIIKTAKGLIKKRAALNVIEYNDKIKYQ